jgi:primosomal protein N' (replication factor Y)
LYAEVAVDVPVYTPFTYEVPEALEGRLHVGHLVHVPFRNRSTTGLVCALTDELPDPELAGKIKPLVDVIDPEPVLDETGVEFLEFIANYYLAPIGRVMRLAIPSAVKLEGIKHYTLQGDADPRDALELEPGDDGPTGPDADLARAVELLESQGTVSIESLKKAVGSSTTFVRLTELEERGLVDVDFHDTGGGAGVKEEVFYRIISDEGDGGRVGSKQARILDLLDDQAWVPRSDITPIVDSPYSSLDGLEDRGFVESKTEEVYRDPFKSEPVPEPTDHDLTETQQEAVDAIEAARQAGRYEGFLLHGVTGSGKTEVYRRAIQTAIDAGESALVLLPEIALTPQFVATFRAHFDDRIAVLHSGLTQAERFDQWRRINRDEVDIVIGARSALFAPLANLGVLVVDEEHDSSFKQERGPRYNARDMALVRGKLESARVILGSATPSLESYQNARSGRLTYLTMPDRVESRPMPEVETIDMRDVDGDDDRPTVLSRRLHEALQKTFADDKQAILFLNRRGYSPCVVCDGCGEYFECPNCDVSLTYHRRQESLRCHHCDHSVRMPERCPKCGDPGLSEKGIGTEQLEKHLDEVFEDLEVGRLDRDTSTGKKLRALIQRFRAEKLDVLAGTQMVTKGHDFPNVVTVGVVHADLSLNFPDFRSAERTFQLLTQVSGRAGRGDHSGRVYVQTLNPEHEAIQAATEHDYQAFAHAELKRRKEQAYPPFGHLIAIKFEAKSNNRALQAARHYASAARSILRNRSELAEHVMMLGPAMPPLSRVKGRSRWQVLLRSRQRSALRELARRMLSKVGHFDAGGSSQHRNVRIIVDVDPQSML